MNTALALQFQAQLAVDQQLGMQSAAIIWCAPPIYRDPCLPGHAGGGHRVCARKLQYILSTLPGHLVRQKDPDPGQPVRLLECSNRAPPAAGSQTQFQMPAANAFRQAAEGVISCRLSTTPFEALSLTSFAPLSCCMQEQTASGCELTFLIADAPCQPLSHPQLQPCCLQLHVELRALSARALRGTCPALMCKRKTKPCPLLPAGPD